MDTRIETVALEVLTPYNPEMHLPARDHQITDVALLNPHQDGFKASLLYIAKASDLYTIAPPAFPANIVCFSDSPVPPEYLESSLINIIILSGPPNLKTLYADINNFLLARRRFKQGESLLFDALLSGKGLQHILDAIREFIGNPLYILDISYKILAKSSDIVENDPLWCDMVEKGYGSYEHTKFVKDSGGFEKVYSSDTPAITEFSNTPYRWMACRIVVGGKVAGMISILEYHKPFDETDQEFLRLLCKSAAFEIQRSSFLNLSKGVIHEFFLTDLLAGKLVNPAVIEDRAKTLDLQLKELLYVLTVRLKPEASKNISLPYLRDLLEGMISNSRSIIYGHDIVTVIGRRRNKPLRKSDLGNLYAFLEENQMDGGLSRSFHHLAELRNHAVQAAKAIELGIRLKLEKAVFWYEDYALFHLLDTASGQIDLKSICSPYLLNLIDYDRKNHTDFTESLYVYLSCGNNLAEAAQVFNIHRNSMDYRIKKIEEILDIKLNDTELCSTLYNSFKILLFVEGKDFLKI